MMKFRVMKKVDRELLGFGFFHLFLKGICILQIQNILDIPLHHM